MPALKMEISWSVTVHLYLIELNVLPYMVPDKYINKRRKKI